MSDKYIMFMGYELQAVSDPSPFDEEYRVVHISGSDTLSIRLFRAGSVYYARYESCEDGTTVQLSISNDVANGGIITVLDKMRAKLHSVGARLVADAEENTKYHI